MVVRQGVFMRPPRGARFAVVTAQRPDEAVFAATLEDLQSEGGAGEFSVGVQVGVDEWMNAAQTMFKALPGSVLVTLLTKESAGRTVRAMARVGAQASADTEAITALGAISEPLSNPTVMAVNNTISAWRDIARRYGTLTSSEVATRVGSKARNKAGAASDLVKAGRLIALRRGVNRYEFPDFQFTADGSVIAVVADVIAELRGHGWSNMSIAIWASSPSGWLNDEAPADVWADPSAAMRVRHAAHQDAIT